MNATLDSFYVNLRKLTSDTASSAHFLILTVFGRGVVVVDVVVVVVVEEGSVMSPGKTTGTGRLTGRTWPR